MLTETCHLKKDLKLKFSRLFYKVFRLVTVLVQCWSVDTITSREVLGNTGKFVSEALILESFTQNMTTDCSLIPDFSTIKIQVQNKNCFECQSKKQFLYKTCSELVFFGEFNEQSLVIYWVNWYKMRASEKDLPVLT